MANGTTRTVVALGAMGGLLGLATIIVIGTRDDQGNIIQGELQPDGRTRCVNKLFNCTAFTPATSQFKPDGGPPYVNLVVSGQECLADDGGTFFNIPQVDPELLFEPMLCTAKPGLADAGVAAFAAIGTEPDRCACRGFIPDAGNIGRCFVALPDGGPSATPIPYGETIFPGRFSGRDCVAKECGEVAGISSWPSSSCPTGVAPDGGLIILQ